MSSYTIGVCCPQCSQLAYATVNYKWREQGISCDECGYCDYAEGLGNEETVEEALQDGWEIYWADEGPWKIHISRGYGTIWFARKSGRGFGIALAKPISQQSIDRILKRFEHPQFDKRRCTLKVWDIKKHRLIYVYPRRKKR